MCKNNGSSVMVCLKCDAEWSTLGMGHCPMCDGPLIEEVDVEVVQGEVYTAEDIQEIEVIADRIAEVLSVPEVEEE